MASTVRFSKYLRYLLLPVARFCIRNSLKLQDVLEEFKQLLISAAEDDLKKQGIAPTANKLSLMTGVHRKDISRISHGPTDATKRADLMTRIIGQWQSDQRFRTRSGGPRVLSFNSGKGEFSALVSSVSREVSPYTVLSELQRVGFAEQTPNGVKLLTSVYTPKGNLEEGFSFLEQDLDDLINSVEENLIAESDARNLHITTEYNNIPESKIDSARAWLFREGERFHKRSRDFLAKLDRDVNPKAGGKGNRSRICVSSFSRIHTFADSEEPNE